MWEALTPYSKAIVAFLTAAVTWATAVVSSESSSITSTEWIGLAGSIVAVLAVYLVPNATKDDI